MAMPIFADYVQLLLALFAQFLPSQNAYAHRGHPFVYRTRSQGVQLSKQWFIKGL